MEREFTRLPRPVNRYGHFSHDGRAYIITNPRAPRHWYNYLWNARHVALVSQVGQGESLSQDEMGRRVPLVARRMLFIRDRESDVFWSANALPPDDAEDYRCIHTRNGATTITMKHESIVTSLRIFVPADFLGEIWTLRIANFAAASRRLQIFPFVDTLIDGPTRPQAYYMSVGRGDRPARMVSVRGACRFFEGRHCSNFLLGSEPISGYDSSEQAFIGYGTWQSPEALRRGGCGNSACEMEKPILALEHRLTLTSGEARILHWGVGSIPEKGDQKREMAAIKRRFFSTGGVEQALLEVRQHIEAELGGVTFETPDSQLNAFASFWLPRQISLGAQWARVRHNGFRDQMQDIAAMAFFNPPRAWRHFERVLAYQYPDGHAPRTWLHGQILDKNFADNHVWIALTAYNLIMERGDVTLLRRLVPFNDGSEASVFEHIRRAVDHLWQDRGRFGLCRIRGGDWNDGLDQVGVGGEGVSVWLSMAWYLANRHLATLARLLGEEELAREAGQRGQIMRQAVNRHGWDGEYYLRAYDDAGRPLGSRTNRFGSVYLNPQSWAVISGIAERDRARQALLAAEARLQSDVGLRIMAPG